MNLCQQNKNKFLTSLTNISEKIVSVLHQDEGGIAKSIPDGRKISQDPRDFPRAKPEGNLEGRGKSGGQRGWISQYLPSFGGVLTISQHKFFYREWIRKSFPGQGRIDSVKINPSLLMMEEWQKHEHLKDKNLTCWFPLKE